MSAELIEKCIAENARVAQNQEQYEIRYNGLAERYEKAREQLNSIEAAILKKQSQYEMMSNFVDTLKNMPNKIDCFDENTWYALVDYVTVYSKDDIRFMFKNGTEISV